MAISRFGVQSPALPLGEHRGETKRGLRRELFLLAVSGLVLLAALLPATAGVASADGCQYVLGFRTLHDLNSLVVGDCVDNQAFAANGDALQHSAKGLLAWRKADNWTAFTDGYRTWINGPTGLVSRLNTGPFFPWEAAPIAASAVPATGSGWSLAAPQGWKVDPSNASTLAGSLPGSGVMAAVTVARGDSSGAALSTLAPAASAGLTRAGASISSQTQSTMHGLAAQVSDFSSQQGIIGRSVSWIEGGQFWMLLFIAKTSDSTTAASILDYFSTQIASTFKIG